MINVRINEQKLKEMFRERLAYWKDNFDDAFLALLDDYLSNQVDEGLFEGIELDIMQIIDNAVINDFDVRYESGKAKLIDCRSDEVVLEKEWQ